MNTIDIKFDMQQALADLKSGKRLSGKDSLLTTLIKQLTEAAPQAEQEQHLVWLDDIHYKVREDWASNHQGCVHCSGVDN